MLPNEYIAIYEYVSYPCVRSSLILFNILLWFAALFIIWIGVWLQMDFENYLIFNALYSPKVPLVLMIAGAIIILITSLACSCTVRINSFMLIIYGGCLITILFSLIALSIYISTYKEQLLDTLPYSIAKQIHQCNSPNATNFSTKYIDVVKEQCCDADTNLNSLQGVTPTSFNKFFINSTDSIDVTGTNLKDLISSGCYRKFRSTIDTNFTTITVTLSALALIPLFASLSSFGLYLMHPKHTYEIIV